jgi:nucleoside 2-deoxyribosyltransferase
MPKLKSVYVASSVKNPHQPLVVLMLKQLGYEDVYDFHHPSADQKGFRWDDISPEWQQWSPEEWRVALASPAAKKGYKADREGMDRSECCVLVLPCGRSAHLEAGFMAGQGKPVFTLALDKQQADLMSLLLGPPENICISLDELAKALER